MIDPYFRYQMLYTLFKLGFFSEYTDLTNAIKKKIL